MNIFHPAFIIASIWSIMPNFSWANDGVFHFYGIFDIAYGHQSNGLPPNANNGASIVSTIFSNASNPNVGSHAGLWSGGISQNRMGITGNVRFNNDWHGGYLLETGINIINGRFVNNSQGLVDNSGFANSAFYQSASTNGSQNGQFINREGYLSLGETHWGSLRLGRNNTLINDTAQQFDPTYASQVFGFLTSSSGFGGGSGVSETTRLNRSVKYLNQLKNIQIGLFHAQGDGSGLSDQGRANGVGLGFTSDHFKMNCAYTSQTDAIKESVATIVDRVAATVYNSKGWILGASYLVNDRLTFKMGKSHYSLSAPTHPQSTATLGSIHGFMLASSPTNYSGSDINAQLNWVGVNYTATDKVTVYSGYYRANYDGYTSTVGGGRYTATAGGVQWTSLLVNYRINDHADTYFALAHIHLDNTSKTTAITGSTKSGSTLYSPIASNQLLGLGFRYKF